MKNNKKTVPIKLKDPKKHTGDFHPEWLAWPTAGALLGNFLVPGIGGVLIGGLIGSVFQRGSEEKAMARVPIFYSFHFNNDVMRVQQIRNIGSIEGNPPVNPNDWEKLKQQGSRAVQNWIDQNMKYKRCVVVLVGSETATRPWVQYEIERAWEHGKAIIGIHIHNIRCARGGTSKKGKNPFDNFKFENGEKLSSLIPCYDPNPTSAYRDIAANIETWIHHAIRTKRN
ncbi:TIR domain-containing protein [Alcanivorax sp.]|uniref:TIR domain-containing protein n=1 Tax=Alcanivorax sp. TaxID=1872427 RepID=UPI002613C4FC|nr:TIR domain-containing protein [Alcanivorax sp.]